MLFKIIHRTCYHYSEPVLLEPMTVRLRPRSDATQTLKNYTINITPSPSGISNCTEFDGNNIETVWFREQHTDLTIVTNSLVETHHGDPFNFLITEPSALNLPIKYLPHIALMLERYRVRDNDDPQVAKFTQEIIHMVNHKTIPFLSLLAEQIPKRIQYMLREYGDPWKPGETMKKGQGSCRDFAILFIDICRSVGIAARFVSGYCIGDKAAESHMHAWAETYLPGAGWRGFDPSQGLSTFDNHIAVAVGQRSQDATPISGNFRGTAESYLNASISINRIEDEVAAT